MIKRTTIKRLSLLALAIIVASISACKSSDFQDIFLRCSPECTEFDSPVPIEEVVESFTQVIETLDVDDSSLSGRWVMLSGSRYTFDQSDVRSVSDLLFTKSMAFTQSGSELEVSDCYQTETYDLVEGGFVIPKDSVFFSSLYFENESDIQVTQTSNILLETSWTFVTLQETQATVDVSMYKVSDDNSPTVSLGQVNSIDNIYCYSYLHLFTAGEQLFQGQWIPGENEIKEMLLKIDPASGDQNIALGSNRTNDTTEYGIFFNKDISGEEYECFGINDMGNTTEDFLTFGGSFDIQISDSTCNTINGQSLGENIFTFSVL